MKLCWQYAKKHEKWWQFIRFCLVGVSNTAVYFAVYYLLLSFHVQYLVANFFGWIVSVGNSFVWSRQYVFTGSRLSGSSSLWRVYVSYALTLFWGTCGLHIFIRYCGFSEKIAPWLVYFMTVPLNFMLNKYWVFPK